MRFIDKIIKDLPLGASALVEDRVNHKNVTIIVIKDRFKNFMEAPWEMEVHFKGGLIKSKKILSAHIMLKVIDNFNEKYYPFHFNYFDENSLKLLHNLTKQSEICVIISDGNNEYMSKSFDNNLRPFLRKYMKETIGCGYQWNNEEYRKSLSNIIKSFQDIKDLWNKLGKEVYMDSVKK